MRRVRARGPVRAPFLLYSPNLINPNGAITGYYVDSAFVHHGFLRDRNGVITTFDAPGAGTGFLQGTQSFAISPGGEITGFYFDATDAVHGFLRDKKGVITTFDLPGAGTGPSRVRLAAALLRTEPSWESSSTRPL